MRKVSFVIAAVLLLSMNLSALAQDEDEEERDLLEICFYGGLGIPAGGISDWHDTLGAKSGWDIGIDLGYFATTNLLVGINFVYTQFGIDGHESVSTSKHRLYNPNLYAKYYFVGESNLEPYVRAHVGVENPKFLTSFEGPKYQATSYDPAFAFGFGAGLFWYTADYSGLYVEANYHYASTKSCKREYDEVTKVFGETLGVLDIHAGIRILIGSGE